MMPFRLWKCNWCLLWTLRISDWSLLQTLNFADALLTHNFYQLFRGEILTLLCKFLGQLWIGYYLSLRLRLQHPFCIFHLFFYFNAMNLIAGVRDHLSLVQFRYLPAELEELLLFLTIFLATLDWLRCLTRTLSLVLWIVNRFRLINGDDYAIRNLVFLHALLYLRLSNP